MDMLLFVGFDHDQGSTTPTKIELPGIYSEFVCGSTMKIGRIDDKGFKRRSDLYELILMFILLKMATG